MRSVVSPSMTSEDMRGAVERIKSDPEFAKRAYEEPEAVLPIEFDLDPSQWQAVHRALAADANPDDEEVAGFVLLDWGSRQIFPNLDALVSPLDASDGGQSMAEIIVSKARPEDQERLAEAFADAFAEDPIFEWLLERKPRRDRRLTRFFRILLRDELRQSDHEVYLSEDGSGGAIWKGVDRWKTPPSTILRQTPGMALAFGPGNARPWKVLGAMEKIHPREPHYYLETLGTKQAVQGKGVGSAVMSLMLDRCDREGVPAYLESSNPMNIPLYARHGFEVRDPVPLPAGAPVLTPMWREPRVR